MTDGIIDFDGFEKYGQTTNGLTFATFVNPGNFAINNVAYTNYPNQGFNQEWSGVGGAANARPNGLIVGLLGSGIALCLRASSNGGVSATRNMPTNYARVMLGFAIMFNLVGSCGVELRDAGTAKISVGIDSSGRVNVWRGSVGGTILFTSGAIVASGTRHFIELDAKINNTTGHYQVWMDGVSLFNSDNAQNTSASGNAFVNQIVLNTGGTDGSSVGFDDMVWRDNTGATLTPYGDIAIKALQVTSDDSKQFTQQATALGTFFTEQTTTTDTPGISLVLVPVTPAANVTLSSVSLVTSVSALTAKLKGVVYSDSAGSPGSLLSDGTEVVGITADVAAVLPLATPQSLVGGTQYWVGYYSDTSLTVRKSDTWHSSGQRKLNTYASNAPAGPLAGMTTGQNPWVIWGNGTSGASNYPALSATSPPILSDLLSYNRDSVVGHEDVFVTSDLAVTPSTIYAVKLSALSKRSAAGTRTMDLEVKSGSATGTGSNPGITPGTTAAWSSTRFDTDPNTGLAWTQSGINAMKVGYKVAS